MKAKLVFLVLLLGSVGLALSYFLYQPAAVTQNQNKVPSLQAFHADFRKANGEPYSDAELAELLLAKGIPFKVEPQHPPPTPANPVITLHYITREFSAAQQQEINQKLSTILTNYSQTTGGLFRWQSLQKGFVTSELKLQLFFSKEFKAIADEESKLTDFNESLHELGFYGLRGVEIFIEERPLSEYLKEVEARRNAEAMSDPKSKHQGKSVR